MSFSATVKDELCRLELGKNCCMLSELAALYRTSGSLTFHGGGRVQVQYRVENTALARRIFRLLTARMAITPRLHYVQHARLGGRRTCVLTIGDEDSQRLMLALHLIDKDENGVVSYRRTIGAPSPDAPVLPQGISAGCVPWRGDNDIARQGLSL